MRRMRFLTDAEINGLQTAGVKFNERHAYTIPELEKMDGGDLFNCLSGLTSVIDHRGDYISLISIVEKLKNYIDQYDSKDPE